MQLLGIEPTTGPMLFPSIILKSRGKLEIFHVSLCYLAQVTEVKCILRPRLNVFFLVVLPRPKTNVFISACDYNGGMQYKWRGTEKKPCDVKECVPKSEGSQHPQKINYTFPVRDKTMFNKVENFGKFHAPEHSPQADMTGGFPLV